MSTATSPWGPPTTPIGVPADVGPALEFKPPREPHPTLPLAAGLGALVVLTLSLLASKYVLDLLVDFAWPVAVYVALLAAIGYGPSIAWWWYASGRWGSGERFGDVGMRPRWSDLGWGPLIWLATVIVQTFVGAIVLGFDIPLSNNTDDIGELSADRTYAVAIVIAAVIAAPLVEELVFRGVLLVAVRERIGAPAAVVVSALVFALIHQELWATPEFLVPLFALALVFGTAFVRTASLTATVVGHATFNAITVVLALTTT